MSQLIENPYRSPKDARRRGAQHVLAAAEQINPLLEQGNRVFNVAIGIADDIAKFLVAAHDEGEPGWSVTIKPCAENTSNLATLVVTGPDDWKP